jgi:phosphatidylethanolamine/phosphatidyl-N-methylethanolamine N-methyltransferase
MICGLAKAPIAVPADRGLAGTPTTAGADMRDAPSYQTDYIENYDQNNAESTLAGRFMGQSHALLEKTLPGPGGGTILEVGAGSGHHFPYVRGNYTKYIMTDGSPEMLAITSNKYHAEVAAGTLEIRQQDATGLRDYSDRSIDRLIATHVLEHLPQPVAVLKEWNRVVRPGGIISLVLPCDPGLLWRFGRHLGPRRNAKRAGLPYDYLQAAEHINSIFNLVVFIRHHFDLAKELWYPVRIPVPDLNLFYICHIVTTPED